MTLLLKRNSTRGGMLHTVLQMYNSEPTMSLIMHSDCAHVCAERALCGLTCRKMIRYSKQIWHQGPCQTVSLLQSEGNMTGEPWESASRRGCALSQRYGYVHSTAEPAHRWNSSLCFSKGWIYDLCSPPRVCAWLCVRACLLETIIEMYYFSYRSQMNWIGP